MAKQNYAIECGILIAPPQIKVDQNGNPQRGVLTLSVIRGNRKIEDDAAPNNFCPIHIFTSDKDMLREIIDWKENDFILVKGKITTKIVKKVLKCPECEAKNREEGLMVYVTPIFMRRLYSDLTEAEARKKLNEFAETSNEIFVCGTLVKDPASPNNKTKKGLFITQYPLALNRSFYEEGSKPEEKTDYPYVKTFGENAKKDKKHLHVGSEVLIDGLLQTRGIVKSHVCENCNEEFLWKDNTMEIIPYSVEYLNNYYSDAELEEMETKKAKLLIEKMEAARRKAMEEKQKQKETEKNGKESEDSTSHG